MLNEGAPGVRGKLCICRVLATSRCMACFSLLFRAMNPAHWRKGIPVNPAWVQTRGCTLLNWLLSISFRSSSLALKLICLVSTQMPRSNNPCITVRPSLVRPWPRGIKSYNPDDYFFIKLSQLRLVKQGITTCLGLYYNVTGIRPTVGAWPGYCLSIA